MNKILPLELKHRDYTFKYTLSSQNFFWYYAVLDNNNNLIVAGTQITSNVSEIVETDYLKEFGSKLINDIIENIEKHGNLY